MPLAEDDARFLRAKSQPVYELPPGLKLHYAPHLVQQTWREWVMGGRKEIGDIRKVAAQDNDAKNDVWTWEMLVKYVIDSQAGREGGSEDVG